MYPSRSFLLGDCDMFNAAYPGCNGDPSLLSNGKCEYAYNTEACGYDGGKLMIRWLYIFMY